MNCVFFPTVSLKIMICSNRKHVKGFIMGLVLSPALVGEKVSKAFKGPRCRSLPCAVILPSNPWRRPISIISLAWLGTTVMTWKALLKASASSVRLARCEYLTMASNSIWYLVSLWIGLIRRSVSLSLKPSFNRISYKMKKSFNEWDCCLEKNTLKKGSQKRYPFCWLYLSLYLVEII